MTMTVRPFGIAALPLASVLVCLFLSPSFAEWDVDGLEELLPQQETEWEAARTKAMLAGGGWSKRSADPPPTGPIRNCAEWEPTSGVLVRYPLGLPYSLLRDFDDVTTIHLIVSSSQYSNARNNLVANGVDTSKVEYLVEANNSIWARDYGPWFVFDGNGDIGIIDHTYNRPWRPDDNLIPVAFGAQQRIPVYSHDMFHTGGNYMTDGAHFSMSTDLVYNEAAVGSGMTEAEVDQLMSNYYGISTYNVITDIASGGIHHIDTWGKFLDEETILIKEVWASHYTYSNLEQRATLIASLPSSTGRNYQVHRVYCQNMGGGEPASYTNSIILNDRIYIPLFGNTTQDNAAMIAYQTAAPGYQVRGYSHSGWLTDDALHCRAKGVIDSGMLRVAHTPIGTEREGPVTVEALVDDRSETGIASVDLHYRYSGGSWQTTPMSFTGSDYYQGVIPEPFVTTLVDYYIQAEDSSGRIEGMPRTEPAAWYTFSITGDLATGIDDHGATPLARLHGNYPNPFNPTTTFRFDLKYREQVHLSIYNVAGREIRTLLDEERDGGSHEIVWDGRDESGEPVPSGVYYYRLRAAGLQYSRPAVLVR